MPLVYVCSLIVAACGGPSPSGLFDESDASDAGTGGGGRAGAAGSSSGASGAGALGGTGAPVGGSSSVAGTQGAGESGTAGGAPTAGQGGQANTGGSASQTGGRAGAGAEAGSGGEGGPCSGRVELCDGVDNDCNGTIDDGAMCPRGCRGHAVQGRGYMFCMDVERSFDGANEACEKARMRLLWIESAAENSAIAEAALQLTDDVERAWIGGADRVVEGDWRWVDTSGNTHAAFWAGGLEKEGGQRVGDQYVNWGADRPNDSTQEASEDCLSFTLDRSGLDVGTWNDDECEDPWPFICEAPDPTP